MITTIAGPGVTSSFPVEELDLTEEQWDEFIKKICDGLDEAEKYRTDSKRLDQWEMNVAQWEGRLKRGDSPGPRDADLDFTQSRELGEQYIARVVSPLLAHNQLFCAEETEPQFRAFAREAEQLGLHIANKHVYRKPMSLAEVQKCVFGTWWVKATWETETRTMTQWSVDEEGKRVQVKVPVTEFAGSRPEAVYTPYMWYPQDAGDDTQKAPWICEEFAESKAQVESKQRKGFYRKDINIDNLGDSTKRDLKKTDLGPDHDKSVTAENKHAPLRLFEWYGPGPAGTDYEDIEVICWVDKESRTCLKGIVNPFHDYQRPYVRSGMFEVLGSLDAQGLMDVLYHLHRAYTAIVNMILDNGSKANEMLVMMAEELGLKAEFADGRAEGGIKFYKMQEFGEDMSLNDYVRAIETSRPTPPELFQLLEIVRGHMHNISSIALAMFGQELANRPTAGGTNRVLTESTQPISLRLEAELDSWADVFEMQLSRYRQFAPDGIDFWLETRGERGKELLYEQFRWPPEYWRQRVAFRTKVSSQQLSREIRMQERMALIDRLGPMIEMIGGMAQAVMTGDPTSQLVAKFLQIYLRLVSQLLDDSGVEGADELEDQSLEALANGEQFAQQIQELEGQIQELQMALSQITGIAPPGSGGGPGGPGPGAPMPGQPGPEAIQGAAA